VLGAVNRRTLESKLTQPITRSTAQAHTSGLPLGSGDGRFRASAATSFRQSIWYSQVRKPGTRRTNRQEWKHLDIESLMLWVRNRNARHRLLRLWFVLSPRPGKMKNSWKQRQAIRKPELETIIVNRQKSRSRIEAATTPGLSDGKLGSAPNG
jgi:hypothetical protein